MREFFGSGTLHKEQTIAELRPTSGRGVSEGQPMSLKAIEKPFITETLQRRNGNRKLAAEDLGLSVSTLYRKINAYGIAPRCRRSGAAKRIGHYDRFGCFPKQIDPVPATV